MRMSGDGRRLVVRLFEPTGHARETTLTVPALGVAAGVRLGPFEIKTLVIDLATKRAYETDLLEEEPEAR